MKLTVRDVIESNLARSVTDMTKIVEAYDNGETTKAQMIQSLRKEIAEIMGKHFDFGFELGVTLDSSTLEDGNPSLLDIEVIQPGDEDDEEDDDVDDMDRPDFEG